MILLENYLAPFNLPAEVTQQLFALAKRFTVKLNHYLLRPGQVCDRLFYIEDEELKSLVGDLNYNSTLPKHVRKPANAQVKCKCNGESYCDFCDTATECEDSVRGCGFLFLHTCKGTYFMSPR
jgi:hypothetical protein